MSARAVMVQGTMSNVGKSVLVAGLCRLFAQDGHAVRPFKAQNMALNSGVTGDGLELGRAQVLQAQAAGVPCDVRMNPVLLKPTGDAGSQVVVLGQPQATLPAREYYARKRELAPVVRRAYASLAAECDIVVIEGAGSPAEINLRDDDFVNMGMAHIASAPVLLAGDIDPGGVFAQLYGTLQLLPPDDRRMVKGLVVNKFRGDVGLLQPGLADLERHCGLPVLGVVPYLALDLDDEDSLSARLAVRGSERLLDVAVIRLPRISNFTDFDALARHGAIGVRYVDAAGALGRPDLVIIPGTKSTMADLRWLTDTGLARCIRALAGGGTPVIGICGGYQMLGAQLSDPHGVEGGGTCEGLGLLPLRTEFSPHKRRALVHGRLCAHEGPLAALAGMHVEGYELHMGHSETAARAALRIEEPNGTWREEGAVCATVWGSYLHGLFDAPGIVDALADALLAARGLPAWQGARGPSAHDARERQLDELAAVLRQALDVQRVYRIVEEGI